MQKLCEIIYCWTNVQLGVQFTSMRRKTKLAELLTNSSNIQDGTLGRREKKNDFINCQDLSFNLLICKSWEWITCLESEQYSPPHRGKNGKELVKLETAMNWLLVELFWRNLAKNIRTWIPISSFSCLPISTNIPVSIACFILCKPLRFPTTFLHLSSLNANQTKYTVNHHYKPIKKY